MIAHVSGTVVDKRHSTVVIDVNGLGYEVHMTEADLDSAVSGSEILVHTYFAVRENAQELYGFLAPETKRLFELLLGVSGVGPKVAMAISGLGEAAQIKSAIAGGNVAFIQSASGVGKRGAEKVIVELKDKVGPVGDDSFVADQLSGSDDAIAALQALGYSQAEASRALAGIDSKLSVEERIKAALAEMDRS